MTPVYYGITVSGVRVDHKGYGSWEFGFNVKQLSKAVVLYEKRNPGAKIETVVTYEK